MAKKEPKSNKIILGITYIGAALFLGLAGYMGYFLQVQSENVINNSYNARLDSFANRVVRGRILAADGTVFDHVVGYSSNGKTGIESMANFYLLTSHVNLAEQVVNELGGTKSQGDDVYTTLDPELQQAAWAALGDRKGAVIAVEPDTGKILAMVSKPGYDPNTLSQD